jgi:hypothetical protein
MAETIESDGKDPATLLISNDTLKIKLQNQTIEVSISELLNSSKKHGQIEVINSVEFMLLLRTGREDINVYYSNGDGHSFYWQFAIETLEK